MQASVGKPQRFNWNGDAAVAISIRSGMVEVFGATASVCV
jgi:hypothetical protein